MDKRVVKRVTPGDIVGVEEEFIPGYGAYIDEEGYIRSQLVGITQFDLVKRIISIKHVKDKPLTPKPGAIVEGIITGISDDLAFVNIYAINEKFSRSINFTGIIHVSQASNEYIKSLYEAFRLGEVIKAKVLNDYHPYQLTTREPGLGVIVAYCSRCGYPLYRKDDRLYCPRCDQYETRKISVFYLFRE